MAATENRETSSKQRDFEAIVEQKRAEIKNAMRELGQRIQSGDDRELLHWIIPDQLACAHRPLRYHPRHGGSRMPLAPDATPLIEDWVELIKVEGIKSILSLMHDGDLNCYRSLPLGNGDLLAYFEAQDIIVAREEYEDPAHKKTPAPQARKALERIREAALKKYDTLPKPVLIQCSAGEDRSAPVAAYIYAHRAPRTL
ncbi:MAG: hypothetical protein JWO19_1502 [Bryobacterales bacterium]|nr:hypothetical protein [Bryobacterales bacterium]